MCVCVCVFDSVFYVCPGVYMYMCMCLCLCVCLCVCVFVCVKWQRMTETDILI